MSQESPCVVDANAQMLAHVAATCIGLRVFFFPYLMPQPFSTLGQRVKMQEMRHWYESEEYQLEMTQRQLDFDEKNMSLEPGKSE